MILSCKDLKKKNNNNKICPIDNQNRMGMSKKL